MTKRGAGDATSTQAIARGLGLPVKRLRPAGAASPPFRPEPSARIGGDGNREPGAASTQAHGWQRFSELGALAQACVPGFYAWIVTVAPAAWMRGAPWLAKVLAVLGIGALFGAAWLEARAERVARLVAVWGLPVTSALVWLLAPAALAPTRLDVGRGLSGMIGWALFAYAAAAPPVRKIEGLTVRDDPPLKPRGTVPRGDAAIVAVGVVLGLGLQVIGWRVLSPERALLVRLTCLSAGIGLLGAATSIALARHAIRARVSPRRRTRLVLLWIGVVAMIATIGLVGTLVAAAR